MYYISAGPPSPIISRQPTGNLSLGSEVTLTCKVSRVNPPATVEWYRDLTYVSNQQVGELQNW